VNEKKKSSARERQDPLRERYKEKPEEARITDRAIATGGDDTDPFHGVIRPGSQDYGVSWRFGIHRAVGGHHDAPNPGDLLCAALAACLDSTIRIIANRLGVTLAGLEVEVTGEVDVRGTLMVGRNVPVGFKKMHCRVDIQTVEGTNPKLVETLLAASENSCVNMQTLRSGVPIETTVNKTFRSLV